MLKIVMSSFNIRYNFLTERDRVFIFDMAIIFYDNTLHNDLRIRKAAFPCRKNITAHSSMYASYHSNSEFAFVIISKHALLGIFVFNNSEM